MFPGRNGLSNERHYNLLQDQNPEAGHLLINYAILHKEKLGI